MIKRSLDRLICKRTILSRHGWRENKMYLNVVRIKW